MKIEKFESNARSSRVVVAGDMIFIGGTTAPAEVDGIQEQTRWVLNRLETLLEEHGFHKADLLSSTIFIRSMDDFDSMNVVWNDWLKDVVAPTRACVSPALVGNHALVEISLIGGRA